MPHWSLWGIAFVLFCILAYVLERYRKRWYQKRHAAVALIGVVLGGLVTVAMMLWSADIPLNQPPMDLIWWTVGQTWIVFAFAAVPILVWDRMFVDKSRDQALDDLTAENERLVGLYDKALVELQQRRG